MLVTLRVPTTVGVAAAARPDPKGKARPVDDSAEMARQPCVAEVLLHTVSGICKVWTMVSCSDAYTEGGAHF